MSTGQEKWAYLSLTKNGLALCNKIKQQINGDILTIKKRADQNTDKAYDLFQDMVDDAFDRYDCLVFVMAAGIVVRSIAGLVKDKTKDSAVLVLDEKGEYCISLLSGHIGGANRSAKRIADAIGAAPVITTASDVTGKTAVDTLAEQNQYMIADMRAAKDITAMIVNGGRVMVCGEGDAGLPPHLKRDNLGNAHLYDAVIHIGDCRHVDIPKPHVRLIPRTIIAGMGCVKGKKSVDICAFIDEAFQELGLHNGALAKIVSAHIKKNEEGIIEASKKLGVPFETLSIKEIRRAEPLFEGSDFVRQTIGVSCVAQPCGYLASNRGEMLLDIKRKDGMTLSFWRMSNAVKPKGKVFVVSTGPGSRPHMTSAALEALNKCDAVAGYTSYIKQIEHLIKDKEIIQTGMHKETERCRSAVEMAAEGRTVALVSGGDAGVYGMAGLVLEIVQEKNLDKTIDVKIVPGVTSATACASLLGAPLMHDFVVISLSDWLTDIKTIEKRLDCAGRGDFVVVIYNPKSAHRPEIINMAQQIMLNYQKAGTPVGIVRNAYRERQEVELTTLKDMCISEINMRTTVVIGNSASYIRNGKMITPRGYKL